MVDILPRTDLPSLKEYFMKFPLEARQRVKFFCTDMHGGFISLVKQCFPGVTVCIDMFHVVNLLNDNEDSARMLLDMAAACLLAGDKEGAARAERSYRLLKKADRLLKTPAREQAAKWRSWTSRNRETINKCLDLSGELREAYGALQAFHGILAMPSYADRRACLTEFLASYCSSEHGVSRN